MQPPNLQHSNKSQGLQKKTNNYCNVLNKNNGKSRKVGKLNELVYNNECNLKPLHLATAAGDTVKIHKK